MSEGLGQLLDVRADFIPDPAVGVQIFLFGGRSLGVGYAISPAAVGFSVFIMIIESFVAMVQAFIFTQLSIIFINAAIHPEH